MATSRTLLTVDDVRVEFNTRRGKALVLTSAGPLDENSFAAPTKIAPREEQVSVSAPSFTRTFPAHSVTVLRLRAER